MCLGLPWVRAAQTRRQILDAGRNALRAYTPKPYNGPVMLFRATKMPPGVSENSQMGWAKLAVGGLETHLIPGYFSQIIYEPRVQALATKLKDCLDRAQAGELNREIKTSPALFVNPGITNFPLQSDSGPRTHGAI
jgi:thioesterase domain-containing protein